MTFGYDALGRVTSETSPVGTFVEGYDLAGRRTSLAWPDGFQVTYTRLVTGELNTVVETATGVYPIGFGYDDLGQRAYVSKANGHGQGYTYDAASRLTGVSLAGGRSAEAGL